MLGLHSDCVRDHIPLEQGLRQKISCFYLFLSRCQRPYSIRTRIKTLSGDDKSAQAKVRDHIPLEQGLRLDQSLRSKLQSKVRDHIPLEQGLRLDRFSHNILKTTVRDHIPLEQGLRP